MPGCKHCHYLCEKYYDGYRMKEGYCTWWMASANKIEKCGKFRMKWWQRIKNKFNL